MAKVVGTADWRDRIGTEEGIRTLALGPQAYVQVNDPRYVSDAYQYYLQGMGGGPDAATIPAAPVVQDPTTMIPQTGGEGITAASAAQNMGGAGGAQNPLTQMITDPTTGQTQTVKQAMTETPQAYSIPGQMPKTPVSGVWSPLDYHQPEPFVQDPMGMIPQLGSQQDPSWWESARDKFVQTGQDVGNTFKDLAARGIDIGKMAGSAIMNAIEPGLGLITQLPISSASGAQQDLVKDQFVDEGVILDDIGRIQRQEGLAYDTPENVMAGYVPGQTGLQIGDLKIGGGTIQESVVDRLSTLEKTKNEKYGGSFYNEDGTPKINPDTGEPTTLGAREEALKENLNMVARASGAVTLDDYDPIGKKAGETTYATDYFPELGQEDVPPENIITPKAKPEVVEDKIKLVDTIAGNTVFVNTKTGEVFPDETLAYESLDPMGTGAIPPGEIGGPGYVEPPTPDNILASALGFDYMGVSDEDLLGPQTPTETPVTEIIGPAGIEPFVSDFGEDVDIDQGFVDTTPEPEPTFTPRGGGADRDPAPAPKSTPSFTPRGGGADRDPAPSSPAPDYSGVTTGGPPGRGGSPSSCFLKGTPVTMADGSTKAVEQVDLGDEVAVGGKVFAVGRFLNKDLHDYKGIKVSGSHTVNEDNKWIRVEDSKHGKPLGDDEHIVYVFGAENRRILINNILFTDYFEVNEQEKLIENEEDYFKNWKLYIKKDDINKINVLNAN
jgi:hypothetical protein